MAKLIIEDETCYLVDGQKLKPGMRIRFYDECAAIWFEGEVSWGPSYDHEKEQLVSGLALAVEGYEPSPLRAGNTIEIVSEAELYNREMQKRNRIRAKCRDKPCLPFHDGE